jgi:hypothetical protein
MDIITKFNEEFKKQEGEKINIIKVLTYLKIEEEGAKGKNFKKWATENNIIGEEEEVENEGRSYYLKNYTEKNNRNVNFAAFETNSIKLQEIRRSRRIGSVASTSVPSERASSPLPNTKEEQIIELIERQNKTIEKIYKTQKKLTKHISAIQMQMEEQIIASDKFKKCMESKSYMERQLREYYENEHIKIEVREEVKGRNYKRNITEGQISRK